jgi:MerR HTH family regulatory protein
MGDAAANKGRGGERKIDQERGVFMISVAAELAEMHPQTLRMYEARGLITPKRSPKNTRLYSQADVDRLRRIQQMTSEEGLNLAGVETVHTSPRAWGGDPRGSRSGGEPASWRSLGRPPASPVGWRSRQQALGDALDRPEAGCVARRLLGEHG